MHTGLPQMQYGRSQLSGAVSFTHRTRDNLLNCRSQSQLTKLGDEIARWCDRLNSVQYRQMIQAWAEAKARLDLDAATLTDIQNLK